MPTVLTIDGFKFLFYSDEGNEPCHIHIKKGGATGKIWLLPDFDEDYYYGFTEQEKRKIRKLVKENYEFLIEQWNEYFG
ncbi:MAG: DUF4160 domain-containing protein [Cyclobacteriaceae bacterium]